MDNPLVRIEPGVLIWTVVTFSALLVVLRWKAWGPIIGAIERREKAIRDTIDGAKAQRDEAMRLLEDHKKMLEETRRETARMIEQGRKDAEAARGEMIEKARSEAGDVVEAGRKQIDREARAAVQALRGEAANLAVLAAGRIVKSSLDEASQKRIVEECLNEISGPPGGKI
jgi:F-type H+-transporting ATPase subunit b